MKCPNCGTPEKARVRVCTNCGTAYASEDLLEFRQLEFLIDETVTWTESAKRREPYLKRYSELMERILPAPKSAPVAPPQPAPAPIAPPRPVPVQPPKPVVATAAPAQPAAPVAKPVPAAPSKPKAEAIPFDQWLLSERNIKFALYSGGLLFVLAGLIFIGLNWNLLSGPLKFIVTVSITAFLYAGGLFLMSRKFLKIGGVAILTLASSFVPINFAVLQIYNTMGISNETMWLIASLFAIVVYAVTTIYTRTQSLVHLSLLALASGVSAAFAIFHATLPSHLLAYSILALGFLIAGRFARASALTEFTRVPLVIVSQAAAPILFGVSALYWLSTRISSSSGGDSWVVLAAMFVGVIFYAAADWLEGWHIARWVVGAAFGVTALFTLFQLQLSFNWIGFAMSLTVLAYLIVAYLLEKKQSRTDAMPLLVEAQLAAPVVFTANAILWAYSSFFCTNCLADNPWVTVAALFVGAIFYTATDWLYRASAARWVFGGAFAFAVLLALEQLRLPYTSIGFALMILAFAYLLGAYFIEKKSSRPEAMPFLAESQFAVPALFLASAFLWRSSAGGDNNSWFAVAALFVGALFYVATDRLFNLFVARWIFGGAFAFTILAALEQLHSPANTTVFCLTILALGYLVTAYLIEKTSARHEAMPFLVEAQIAAPVLFAANALLLRFSTSGDNNPWIAIGGLMLGAVFYGATDALYRDREHTSRFAWGAALAVAIFFALVQLQLPAISVAFGMTVLALVYLAAAYAFEKFLSRQDAMPLFAEAQIAAPVLFAASAWLWLRATQVDGSLWLAISVMFLVAAFYLATDLLFHYSAARWALGATFATSTLFAFWELSLPANWVGLLMTVLACGYLGTAYLIDKKSSQANGRPFFVEAQLGAPVLFVLNAVLWIFPNFCVFGCGDRPSFPWLALGALCLVVAFYIATDVLYRARAARWAAAILFAVALIFAMTELRFSAIQTGIVLKVLALTYLGLGFALERKETQRSAGMPFYATAYALATFVTFQSVLKLPNGQFDLSLALIADSILLAVSARIHRNYDWMYGAAWLFMIPVLILLRLYVPEMVGQGVGMGALMIVYAALGYGVGQRAKKFSGPFLSAAAFLSAVVVMMTWANGMIATAVLVVIALLYAFVAVWLGWHWLLLAALAAVNFSVVALTHNYYPTDVSWVRVLALAYGALGIAFVFGGYALRRKNLTRWAMPLYLVAVLNSVGAYVVALELRNEFAVGASVVFAALVLVFARLEFAEFVERKIQPVLSYIGAGMIVVGTFMALDWAHRIDLWQPVVAGVCAILIMVEWLLRDESLATLYAVPARRVGLIVLLTPLAGAVIATNYWASAVTFGIIGIALIADALYRKNIYWAYAGAGAFVGAVCFVLKGFNVTELQAYVMPLALWLLAIGWSEKRRGYRQEYLALTTVGLVVMMGSAFWQSLSGVGYSVLLLGESVASLVWGIRTKTRGYVLLAILSLLMNGVVQFWFGFANLDRWLQLSVIGLLLLVVGLIALFKREQVLNAMQELNRWEA